MSASAIGPPVPFEGVSEPSVKVGCGVSALVVTCETVLPFPAVSSTAAALTFTLKLPAMKFGLFTEKRQVLPETRVGLKTVQVPTEPAEPETLMSADVKPLITSEKVTVNVCVA